jgi:hypothetical protein
VARLLPAKCTPVFASGRDQRRGSPCHHGAKAQRVTPPRLSGAAPKKIGQGGFVSLDLAALGYHRISPGTPLPESTVW